MFFFRVDGLFCHACEHFIVERVVNVPKVKRVCLRPVLRLPDVIIFIHFGDKDKQRIFLNRARKHLFAKLILLIARRIEIEARRCDCKRQRIVDGNLSVKHEFIHLVGLVCVILIDYGED